MKNVVLFALCTFIASFTANSQVVDDKNWTLIHERTADWCPFCGGWGWNFKEKIFQNFANSNVIFIASHHDGGLETPTSVEFGSNFSGAGQPVFYVDGININVSSSNQTTKINETQLEVDFKKSVAAFAGVGIDATLDPTTKVLSVNARVEFLSDVENGDYYLGLYLLEDLIHRQEGRGNQETHRNVLRRSLLSTTFGNALAKGAVKKGESFSITGGLQNITSAKENLSVVGIIWNKVNNKYLFFNANQVKVNSISNTDPTPVSKDINVYQAESGAVVVELDDNSYANAQVIISDVSGKVILQQKVGDVKEGPSKLNLAVNFVEGLHVVTLSKGNQKVSKKIFLQ